MTFSNINTQSGVDASKRGAHPTFAHLFALHFARLRRAHASVRGRCYMVAVVFDSDLANLSFIERGDAAIVGRHDHATICLQYDATVALRHLLVRSRGDNVRVMDLETAQGMQVEGLGACESVVSDGSFLVRVSRYALMFFPAGDGVPVWPTDSASTWQQLSRRSVLERGRGVQNVVGTAVEGAVIPAGTAAILTLVHPDGETVYPLNAGALERGVLLGRYSRCHLVTRELRADESISRVHLVLLKEEDSVLLIDTASSNGTKVNGKRVDLVNIPNEARIDLGSGTSLEWLWLGGSRQASSDLH